jgi:hypothetical protein
MSEPPDREQLRRDLSDALGALQQGKGVLGLLGLTDQLVALGVSYRFHGLLIREALQRKDDAGIIVQLVQVVDKLERGVT